MTEDAISDAPIYQTMISDGHSIFPVSTIEYEGKLWLVPKWLVNDSKGWRTPAHIVCLDSVQVFDWRGKGQPADFVVPAPIPKTVLDRLFQGIDVDGWTLKMLPPIRFQIPREKIQ